MIFPCHSLIFLFTEDASTFVSLTPSLKSVCRMQGMLNDWNQLSACLLRDFNASRYESEFQQICIDETPLNSPRIEATKKLTPEEENHLLSMANPARISPRVYLSIPDAIIAIGEELNCLLRPDINGLPTLITVKSSDARTKGMKRLFTTMVVKKEKYLAIQI